MAKQCKKCGYERQPTDTQQEIECPKCGAIYAKIEQQLAKQKQEMEKKESEKAASKTIGENTVQAIPETPDEEKVIKITKYSYAFLGLFFLMLFFEGFRLKAGILFIIWMLLSYPQKNRVTGTWLASHFKWQMMTVCIGLLLFLATKGILYFFKIESNMDISLYAIIFGFSVWIWTIYRVWKGWYCLAQGTEVPPQIKDEEISLQYQTIKIGVSKKVLVACCWLVAGVVAVYFSVEKIRNIEPGTGTVALEGGTYIGEWEDGKPNGQGTYTYTSTYRTSLKYIGEFKDGRKNGQGTETFANGNEYVGEWENGYMTGQGTMTFPSGGKYVGEWKKNEREGQGTLTSLDGYGYVGEWKEGDMDGQGAMTYKNGDKYVGEWKRDVIEGKGTWTFANGDKYVGEWKNSPFINGLRNFAEWKNAHLNGQGTLTKIDGTEQKGLWENGKFVK